MTLADLLAQYDVSEDDLTASLQRKLALRVVPGSADLTFAEEAFWDKHAGLALVDKEGQPGGADAADEAAALLGEAAQSLTIDQAADLLGVHRSRISHRVSDGQLYSFRLGSQRRLPVWQFTEAGALPGLVQVLAALPQDLHPGAVQGFFTTANPDLGDATVRQWLASGGDPRAAVAEAAGLDRW